MCMYIPTNQPLEFHRNWFKPLTVYKIFRPVSGKEARSPFLNKMYNLGETYRNNMQSVYDIKLRTHPLDTSYQIYMGFHSCATLDDANEYLYTLQNGFTHSRALSRSLRIYECKIPMFSKFMLGFERPLGQKSRHVVSNAITVIKRVD